MFDLVNLNIGGSAFSHTSNKKGRGANSTPAHRVSVPKHLNGDEVKVARGLIKMLNVGHFDPYLIAYHFISNAPGAVLANLMELFDRLLDVLAERYDNDACTSTEEYNAAITAKRVQDALEIWRQGT